MPEYKTLRLVDVDVDFSIQPRVNGLNQDHVDELEAVYRDENATIEPPVVWQLPDDSYKLSQGFHRIEGAKRAGRETLKFCIRKGTADECAIDAFCSNQGHGLKRTNADKRRAVERLLKLMAEMSSEAIADKAGVGGDLVIAIRREFQPPENGGSKLTGRDGKKRAASKPKSKSTNATSSGNHQRTVVGPTPAPQNDYSEPVKQENPSPSDQNTGVQVRQEPPAAEEPPEDESTVMGKLAALLKEVKKLIKRNPLLAKDAAVAIHEIGEEVIEFKPDLKFGEQRPIYESPYFRNKDGTYEGPTVQCLEDVGSKAIDTYGRPVPQHLRDEFCDDGYARIGRHMELAVAELQQADDLYQKMSARPMGVNWCKTQTWNAGFTKAAQLLDDVTAKWWSESVPFTVCRFCMGAMKDSQGIRCLKCNFSGYWPRSEARSHPTMIQDKRPKATAKQEAKS